MKYHETIALILVAAGNGERAGPGVPKQYREFDGEPVLRKTMRAVLECSAVSVIQPVIAPASAGLFEAAVAGLSSMTPVLPPVAGGATRQASVHAGLEALRPHAPDLVLVHDAARPFVTARLIEAAIEAARRHGAAVPALPVTDTVKTIESGGRVSATLDRATLRTVQTPQAFRFDAVLAAHEKAKAVGRDDFSDDAALAEWAGLDVFVFDGDPHNIKLTTAADFARSGAHSSMNTDIRVGSGFDVHVFGEGDHVVLGGVKIPHHHGLSGHSDADVALHALVDAILGALADGDIGAHFPPSDPQWRGASSDRFLSFAVERVAARGGAIAHLDVTIVCEEPKIGPHRDAIRARIAEIAGLSLDRVAVKATTSERLGFTGRGEGIVAMATATIRLP